MTNVNMSRNDTIRFIPRAGFAVYVTIMIDDLPDARENSIFADVLLTLS